MLRLRNARWLMLVALGLCVAGAWLAGSPANSGQAPPAPLPFQPPRGYVCCRATEPLRIDGKLDEPGWQRVPWTDDFVDIEGDKKPKPRLRTRVKMLWDNRFFYLGAEIEEPQLWAVSTTHDSSLYLENAFEVFIDPNGDNHEYYEFEINALNTTWDLLMTRPYKDGGNAVSSWEIPGLKSAIHIDGTLNQPGDRDRSWTIELAFPWKVLGELAHMPAPPRDGDQWRVNCARVEWQLEVVNNKYRKRPGRRSEISTWSPQGLVDLHRPETYGYVQFSTVPPGQATFRPDPDGLVKHVLHQIYYAQRAYRAKHGHWASGLQELVLPPSPDTTDLHPALESSRLGFVASLPGAGSSRPALLWHIRQDALLWSEPLPAGKEASGSKP